MFDVESWLLHGSYMLPFIVSNVLWVDCTIQRRGYTDAQNPETATRTVVRTVFADTVHILWLQEFRWNKVVLTYVHCS